MKQKLKQLFTSGASRQGTYAAGMSVVVIAIVIILNMIVGQLPSNMVQFDITDNKLYTISDTSVQYLAGLKKQIKIIVVAEQGKVDERITKFWINYASFLKILTSLKLIL
jgi:ABC-2 type transport system permease protein